MSLALETFIFRLDYFGKEAYLAQSPQFYKQMPVGVYGRLYEIVPVFRVENKEVTPSFDLLSRGVEAATGGQCIHGCRMQAEKMKERGMAVEELADYLMMHKYGMPSYGRLGLRLERFTARLLNLIS